MISSHRARLLAGGTILVGLLLGTQGAFGDTLTVTADVPDACTVSPGTLAFGTYTPGQGDLIEEGSFDIVCTIGADVNIRLDSGVNPDTSNGTVRRMVNLERADEFLTYDIFQDQGLGLKWGDDGNTNPDASKNFITTNGTTTATVFGRIQGGQGPIGGDYSDTVQIGIVFN